MSSIKKFIEKKLKLKVNDEKSKVAKSDKVKFLGMTIVNGFISISKAALNKAMEKVKELTPRGSHKPTEKAMAEINRWYNGWALYFSMTQYPAQLRAIESHLRRRLRARFVKQQKKPKHLVNKLTKLGVNKKMVSKTVYSNKGTWRLSHTRTVEQAYSNKWFRKQMNQSIFSDQDLPHWVSLKEWVKLT